MARTPVTPLLRRTALATAVVAACALAPGVAGASENACPGPDGSCPPPSPSPAAPTAPAGVCADADLVPTTANLVRIRAATLCLLNRERTSRGERPLRDDPKLGRAATGFSKLMVRRRFFNHVSPNGSTFVQRIKRTGYVASTASYVLGENIAWAGGRLASPRRTMRMWMHSPGHRHNILDRRFREIGIGVALGTPGYGRRGATYTTDFGERR